MNDRMEYSNTVKFVGETPLPTEFGGWTYMIFKELPEGRIHTLMVFGDCKSYSDVDLKDVLVRVHSACATSELFHATNCECREELEEAMKKIQKEGKGMVVYLDQEGAGNGLEAKVASYRLAFCWSKGEVVPVKDSNGDDVSIYSAYKRLGFKAETRSFKVAADMLKSIGVKSVRLLTNNPSKVQGLEAEGITAIPVGLHIKPKNKIVARHLKAKAEELGHKISKKDWASEE